MLLAQEDLSAVLLLSKMNEPVGQGVVKCGTCGAALLIQHEALCSTSCQSLIINIIRVMLEKNPRRITVPKYNVNNISGEYKAHINNTFALLN